MVSPPRVYELSVQVQPGTTQNNPLSVPWVTEDNTILDIELEVPPGHNGLTGIRVVKGGVQLLPWGSNTWITANDYNRVFPVGVYIPTSDLTIQAYNTGTYPHTFYLRMSVQTYDHSPSQQQPSPSDAIPADSVTGVSDPLSPDALIGPDTASALTDGTITADDLTPVDTANLTLPPQPEPSISG